MPLSKHSRLVARLGLVSAAMFAFGFALVPLYEVFCDVTGLNGKNYQRTESLTATASTRQITMQFIANSTHPEWRFAPETTEVKVQLGEMNQTFFSVTNPTEQSLTLQAVPSISPGLAAQYLHKIECFCFQQQHLAPGQQVDMPLRFFVDPALPDKYRTMTLSYTLYSTPVQAQLNRRYTHER